jgi:hypothetical protein
MSAEEQLSDRALARALLARQGLLQRMQAPLDEALEAVGAMQGQAWSALPVGLYARVADFAPGRFYEALARGQLYWGIGIRGTLHLVSAREHPAYAVVADEGTGAWHRAIATTTAGMHELRAQLLDFASTRARSNEEIREFAERWVEQHPRAIDAREVQAQRELKWRPIYRWSALLRVPAKGEWGAKAPAEHLAAPVAPGSAQAPTADAALAALVRAHLRAFGPAAAEDVACWTGARIPAVRQQLQELAGELLTFADTHGRILYDLPDAPRPHPDTPAPARLLGAFDSTLLAYAVKQRTRIVPPQLRDFVYQKANLQIRPTMLLDGGVAGIWSVEVRRGEALLTLQPPPGAKLAHAARAALEVEAQGLLAALYPQAKERCVRVGAR